MGNDENTGDKNLPRRPVLEAFVICLMLAPLIGITIDALSRV